MICRNCGFNNAPGDAFCGSCGQFLEWLGEEPAGQSASAGGGRGASSEAQPTHQALSDETVVQAPVQQSGQQAGGNVPPPPPPPPPDSIPGSNFYNRQPDSPANRAARHSARPQRVEAPPRMARPAPSGVSYGAITCWNCGRRNPASRSFCQQCGERLSVSSLGGYDEGSSGGRGKLIAMGLAGILLLLLAGGAAALFLGGGPAPSPTPVAVVTDSPPPLTSAPSLPPTEAPTLLPSEAPTLPPTAPPITPPPATPVNCASSTVPTNWVNLSGADRSVRVRRNEVWCIHQVIIVPDPNFGLGTIRLRANDGVLAQVTHNAASSATEYPFVFAPATMVVGRQDVQYRMNCATDFCNAIIQVGYELLRQP